MKMRRIYALLALAITAGVLTGCDAEGESSGNSAAESIAATEMASTERQVPEYTVEPNPIEGLTQVERILSLGDNYLMIGLNEYGGRAAVLYNPQTKEVQPKTLKRLSEAGDIMEITQDESGNVLVFYGMGEAGSERYVETYDADMNLIDEKNVTELTEETVDYPTMEIDKNGNHYFFGWDESGNHEVWVYDKEMQFLGSVSGEMLVGDELISAADGKVYLMYHESALVSRFACVNPETLTLDVVEMENLPLFYNQVIPGANGYDFYLNVHEALYGIRAAEGICEIVIDWKSSAFDGNEIRGLYAMPDGSFLVSNAGGNIMDPGTWCMIAKES